MLILDAETGREREPAMDVTSAVIAQIAVSADGRLVAAADWTAEATLWDLRTRERVGNHFPKIPGWVPQVGFEPNGRSNSAPDADLPDGHHVAVCRVRVAATNVN